MGPRLMLVWGPRMVNPALVTVLLSILNQPVYSAHIFNVIGLEVVLLWLHATFIRD